MIDERNKGKKDIDPSSKRNEKNARAHMKNETGAHKSPGQVARNRGEQFGKTDTEYKK